MMNDDFPELAELLREQPRAPDEAFVKDVEWLIELDFAFARRRRVALQRWAFDLGSICAIGCVGFVLAANAPAASDALPMTLAPLLAATAAPFLWLLARSSTAAG